MQMKKNSVSEALKSLQEAMLEENINPRCGLPEELFLFATTLMPTPNIDLFITDDHNRVLLIWRDDKFYGAGWHIPGGCIRIRETLDERIQKTAIAEIGTTVIYQKEPIVTREAMINSSRPWLENELQRSHNISMLFCASLPSGFQIKNNTEDEHTSGYKKWFKQIPDDLLQAHADLYGDILKNYFERGRML